MKRRKHVLIAILAAGFGLCQAWLAVSGRAAAAPAPPAQSSLDGSSLREAASEAAAWLVTSHQNPDGGFSSFSAGAGNAPSDPAGTLDALLALASANADTAAPLAYLAEHDGELREYAAGDGSTAAKVVLGLTAAGANPLDYGGSNYVLSITAQLSPTGEFNVSSPYNQALAIHALKVAGEPVPGEAIAWLLARQASSGELAGSWDDGFGTAGNPDATAMALLALAADAGPEAAAAADVAVSFLRSAQLESGGWEFGPGFGENANSTALAIQALGRRGEDVISAAGPWAKDGRSPVAALLGWQTANGALQADFGQGRQDDFFSTVQAIPALAAAAQLAESGVSAGDVPAELPGGSSAEQPSADITPRAESQAEPETAAEPEPTAVGGDSSLPFVLLGILVILISGALLWFWNERRKA